MLVSWRLEMEKIARIIRVEEQDNIRREDTLKMTPQKRLEALIKLRDELYPYEPIERVVSIRNLD